MQLQVHLKHKQFVVFNKDDENSADHICKTHLIAFFKANEAVAHTLSPIQTFLPNLLGITSRKCGTLTKEQRLLVIWFLYLQMLARNFMPAYCSLLLRMLKLCGPENH
jgi:hypothetical protein